MIEIPCPNCQRVLKVPEKYIGTEGACNYCGGRVQITLKPQQGLSPEDAAKAAALEAELDEARALIASLSADLDAAQKKCTAAEAAREEAEARRAAAETSQAELEAEVARAVQREHEAREAKNQAQIAEAAEHEREEAEREELEQLQGVLMGSREQVEKLQRDLEIQKGATKETNLRLALVYSRLKAFVDELSDLDEKAVPAVTESEAAAIVVGGSGEKRQPWGWLVALAIVLLGLSAAGWMFYLQQ